MKPGVWILALLPTRYVTLGKLLNISGPQFSHLYVEIIISQGYSEH